MMWLLFEEIDQAAFQEGWKAWDENKPGNPYERETVKWYSWNKGWNLNDNY